MTPDNYEAWLNEVGIALQTINMPMEDWQKAWVFDFAAEYKAGTEPGKAADKANRFWWHEQNRSLRQDCRLTQDCWLPHGHPGKCEPVS